LQQAFDLAIKNNPSLQTERLKVKQSERLEQTAFDLPRTDFGAEFGQINSRAFDSRLSASQSFSLPKVYQQRGILLKAETELQRRQVAYSETQLKAGIAMIYYEIQFLKRQKRLFQKQDSVLATNIRNAEIRLKTGESGILEKTTAETQRLTLQHQLKQLETELDFYQIQLQNRVFTEGVSFSENSNLKANFSLTIDTTLLKTHPELAVFKQQIEVAQQQILREQNSLKPSFSVGYALQSIRGTQTFGARDYTYNAIPQFSTLQFGIQLPLFKKATESRIEAAKIGQAIAENQLMIKELTRKKMFQELVGQYKKAAQDIDFYEKTALPQAKRLIDIADISRRNGEIGYAEWSIATMQSWSIEQAHLEAIRVYNRVVVEIQTLFDFKN
jgi:cobalt-zinc-cadmium resistance protein CzcA